MLNLFFGFEGTLSRWKFFFAGVGLEVYMFVALGFVTYNALRLDEFPHDKVALKYALYGLVYVFCSAALISKRLGWKGTNSVVSGAFVATTAGYVVSEVYKTYFRIETELPGFIALLAMIIFVVACFRVGKDNTAGGSGVKSPESKQDRPSRIVGTPLSQTHHAGSAQSAAGISAKPSFGRR